MRDIKHRLRPLADDAPGLRAWAMDVETREICEIDLSAEERRELRDMTATTTPNEESEGEG